MCRVPPPMADAATQPRPPDIPFWVRVLVLTLLIITTWAVVFDPAHLLKGY